MHFHLYHSIVPHPRQSLSVSGCIYERLAITIRQLQVHFKITRYRKSPVELYASLQWYSSGYGKGDVPPSLRFFLKDVLIFLQRLSYIDDCKCDSNDLQVYT
jgi:hypothetical protein